VFPSENPETHLDPDNFYGRVYMTALEGAKLEGVTWHTLATYLRLTACHEWRGTKYDCGLAEAQRDLGARYAHLSPSHLRGALEGISGFGKSETTKARAEPIQEGQDLSLTVSGTGTKQAGREREEAQVVDCIGRGERI
jgi:hypothetical protein